MGWFCVEDDGNEIRRERHPLLVGHVPVTVAKQQELKVTVTGGHLVWDGSILSSRRLPGRRRVVPGPLPASGQCVRPPQGLSWGCSAGLPLRPPPPSFSVCVGHRQRLNLSKVPTVAAANPSQGQGLFVSLNCHLGVSGRAPGASGTCGCVRNKERLLPLIAGLWPTLRPAAQASLGEPSPGRGGWTDKGAKWAAPPWLTCPHPGSHTASGTPAL